MKFPFILSFFPFFLFFGCGKFLDKFSPLSPGFTRVQLDAGPRDRASIFSPQVGGILVYALRSDGYAESLLLANESDSRSMILPNGQYQFVAVGWDATNLEGSTRCGYGNGSSTASFSLVGNNLDIPIVLNTTSCDSDFFASGIFRSGSNFFPLDMVFCHATTDITGFTSGSSCGNGNESHRFIKGRTVGAGVEGPERQGYDSYSNRFIYTADIHVDGRFDLFSVGTNGKGTVRQNPALVSMGSVMDFEVVPGKGKIVYRADQDVDGSSELYLTTIGVPGSTKVSGSIVATGTVNEFFVSADGNYLVFIGSMENVGKNEVYSVDLNTLVRTKISPAATGGGVGMDGAGVFWMFDITPDKQKVVFSGSFSDATGKEIYSVNMSGSPAAVKLHGVPPSGVSNMDILDFGINHNGTRVVWRGDYDVNGINEVYVSTIGSSTAVKISNAPQSGASGPLTLSNTADLVAYAQDESGAAGVENLFVSDFSNLGAVVTNRMHLASSTSRTYKEIRFTPDNSKIAYLSDADGGASILRIFSAVVATPNSKVDLTHANPGSSIPAATGGGGTHLHVDNTYAYYRGDLTGFVSRWGLYRATINTPGSGALVSQPATATSEIKDFMYGLGKVFFTNDDLSDDVHRAYMYTPGGSITDLSLSSAIYQATGLYIPTTPDVYEYGFSFTIPGFPNGMFLEGRKDNASGVSDVFFLPDATNSSATSLVKLTRGYDSSSGSGRFRFSLLEYKRGADGTFSQYTPAISTACLSGPGTDGNTLSGQTFRMPAGSAGTSSPFAAALDVYADSLDCSGTPKRILFPYGIANSNLSPDAGKLKVVGVGSPKIFIKD